MNNKSKKTLGLGLAGVIGIGAISGTISNINITNAAESQAVKDAKAKISHTIWSINNNYAGIKNQAQWEIYIKEARALINKIPSAERLKADELTEQVNGLADTVLAIARINQVEKSITPKEEGGYGNYLGIKNAAQWRIYLELAERDMKSIDLTMFKAKYDELLQRYNIVDAKVEDIEDAHKKDLEKVEALYNNAVKTKELEDAAKALEEAKKLGTHETTTAIKQKIEDLITKLNAITVIKEVFVVDSKTIQIKGEGLTKIKSSDIKVEGNTIASMEVNDDLETLTLGLIEDMIPNYQTTVTIKVNGVNREFKVLNGLSVETVSVKPETFGTDRVGQKVTLQVNGKDTSVEYLKAAGYDVKFVATTTKGAEANIFENNTNTSQTGILKSTNEVANYNIEAQVIKNGSVIALGRAEISIVNLNANATVINDVKLSIGDVSGSNSVEYAKDPIHRGNAYKLNSTTLVTGESAVVSSVLANINGDNTIVAKGNVSVSSSNVGVVFASKDSTTGLWKVTANGPGEAFITVKVGNAEKKLKITVTNTKRTLKEIKLNKSIVTLTRNGSSTVKISTIDQYGDPIAVGETDKKVTPQIGKIDNMDIATVETINTNKDNSIGEQDIRITAANSVSSGSAKINFVDEYRNPNTQLISKNVLASLTVNITSNNVATSRKFEVVQRENHASGFNLDSTLEVSNKEKAVVVELNEYNSDNELLGSVNFDSGNYTVESLREDVVSIDISGNKLIITARDGITGDTTLIAKNAANQIVAQQGITVKNNPTEIKTVNFKSQLPTITYNNNVVALKDILDVEETNGDAIIRGITLTKDSTANVRIAKENKVDSDTEKSIIDKNDLYLDLDGDGEYKPEKDIKLGSIVVNVIGEDIPTGDSVMVKDTYYVEQLAITPVKGVSADATVLVNILKNKTDLTSSVGNTSFKVEVKK